MFTNSRTLRLASCGKTLFRGTWYQEYTVRATDGPAWFAFEGIPSDAIEITSSPQGGFSFLRPLKSVRRKNVPMY